MVIAETAIVIPVLTVVALLLVWGVSLVGTSMTLADAARQVARDVARGVTVQESIDAAAVRAPSADISVEAAGETVTVVASQSASPPMPLLSVISIPLTQSVTIPREWTH